MGILRNLGLLTLVVAVASVLGDYGRDWIAADRCLDAGRVYDYREGRCRDDVIHLPYVPYGARRTALLAGAGALAVLGVALIVLGRRKK
jgi:hypothetical protein